MQIKAVKGTRDILPGETEAWNWIEGACRSLFELYGFAEIRTPLFESTELFVKSTGSDTEIVTKEMYTFKDRGDRSVTLRPEGTPGVVRAAIENGLLHAGRVERFYYIGPMFRYERPQKGRYRQFSQIGAEVFGTEHPAVDAEGMQMALAFFRRIGITNAVLRVNSLGHPGCRPAYREALREAFMPHRESLCDDCRRRLEVNPLRILDCKVPGCAPVKAMAPIILDFLCEDCAKHFEQVKQTLDLLEVPHHVDPRLVRGLDYYTRTAFEIVSEDLGAQNAICGGGRYDDLVHAMGGPRIPGYGFAIGTDRLVLAALAGKSPKEACPRPPDAYIVHLGAPALAEALRAARHLRALGLSARLDPDARDMKKQMSRAASTGARFALIIGERELEQGRYSLKRMSDALQRDVEAGQWASLAREIDDGDGTTRAR